MDFSYPKQMKALRPGIDERKSAWVGVPHRQLSYLLPVIKRSRKIVPVFGDDGTVQIETQEPDEELGKLVNAFVFGTPKPEGNIIELAVERFADFMRLCKKLILTNYDLPDGELVHLLSMTERDLSAFYSIIYVHCTSG